MATTISALDLPFDEAIAFLRQKANVTSENYTDVWGKANVKSYTVAGATTESLVDDFRAETAKAIENGTSLQEFRKSFDAIVSKHGWDHTGTPGWRSRIIFETNLGMAYSAGRYAQQTEPETLAAFPYWQYVHSGALHPRRQHLAWNGLTLRADDPFWSTHYPPNGWRCGCRTRPLSARGLARQGKSGPDTAPPLVMKEYTNRKTGEVYRVPEGIDPGFDYNVGQEWTGQAPQIPANATLTAKGTAGRPAPAAAPPAPVRPAPLPQTDADPVTVIPPAPAAPSAPIPRPPKQKELDLGPVPDRPAAGASTPERPPWPWRSRPRRSAFDMSLPPEAVAAAEKAGIFTTEAEARKLTAELMAGIPGRLKPKVRWHESGGRLRLWVDHPEAHLERSFWRDDGRLKVEHDYFWLAPKHQGGGHALRMLQTSFSTYDRLGVAEVHVHANLDKGGYVWARNGFVPRFPEDLRSELREAALDLDAARRRALLRVVESSSDTDLMYTVSMLQDDAGQWGKTLLLGSDWYGLVDLRNPRQRELLRKALAR